jgi:lactoylglutathione lyase
MPTVTWDHVHLRSPDPEAMAAWLEDVLGGEIIRGPGRIDVKLGGANVFIAPVEAGDGVHTPPVTPYQGLDHFGLTVKDIDACVSASSAGRRASRLNSWSATRSTPEEKRYGGRAAHRR